VPSRIRREAAAKNKTEKATLRLLTSLPYSKKLDENLREMKKLFTKFITSLKLDDIVASGILKSTDPTYEQENGNLVIVLKIDETSADECSRLKDLIQRVVQATPILKSAKLTCDGKEYPIN